MADWEGEVAALYSQYAHQPTSFYNHCNQLLLDMLALKPGVRVLDLAGGAGILSRMILQQQPDAHITILDASGAQLAQATAVFGDRVQYVQQSAEQYTPDVQFDIVVCGNAFWYLHGSVIPRIASWLVHGGQLAFNLHEKNTHFKDVSFFTKLNAEIDHLCRERYRTACMIYASAVPVDQLTMQLHHAGFSVEKNEAAYLEPKENWKVLCELQARRTAPYMAISQPDETKLQLYRDAFKNVSKNHGVERHTLLFNCVKAE